MGTRPQARSILRASPAACARRRQSTRETRTARSLPARTCPGPRTPATAAACHWHLGRTTLAAGSVALADDLFCRLALLALPFHGQPPGHLGTWTKKRNREHPRPKREKSLNPPGSHSSPPPPPSPLEIFFFSRLFFYLLLFPFLVLCRRRTRTHFPCIRASRSSSECINTIYNS